MMPGQNVGQLIPMCDTTTVIASRSLSVPNISVSGPPEGLAQGFWNTTRDCSKVPKDAATTISAMLAAVPAKAT
jgi:hypothetical protein